MNISVLDASTLGNDLDLSLLSELGEVNIFDKTTPDELKSHAKDADVLVLNKVKINEQTLPCPDGIKLICITATGYDNVSLDYCKEHGIALCNVKGYSSASVAQLTVAMALNLACHIPDTTGKPCLHAVLRYVVDAVLNTEKIGVLLRESHVVDAIFLNV